MKIRNVIESIFGSPAKVRILRTLFNSPQPLSGRQVGELSGLTHKGAIHAIQSLVDLGAVRHRKVGKAYQYSLLKGNIFVEKIILPCIRAESGLFDGLKKDITAHFGRDAISLILYGSIVRGEEKRGSDIDLMVVVRDERVKKAVEGKAEERTHYFNKRYNALLSLHCFTLSEIKAKKNSPLIKTIIKESVVISGKSLEDLFR
ncbi:MAG: nucleotidyltransferase domain-containing protein [Nitrospirota bacterium]